MDVFPKLGKTKLLTKIGEQVIGFSPELAKTLKCCQSLKRRAEACPHFSSASEESSALKPLSTRTRNSQVNCGGAVQILAIVCKKDGFVSRCFITRCASSQCVGVASSRWVSVFAVSNLDNGKYGFTRISCMESQLFL